MICKKFINLADYDKVELYLYRNSDLSFTQNSWIINASINYIIKFECFKENLFKLISIQNYILHPKSRNCPTYSCIIFRFYNILHIVFCSFSSLYHFHRWSRICYCMLLDVFFMLFLVINFLYLNRMLFNCKSFDRKKSRGVAVTLL